ncbi:hypothetical protein M3I53_19735 [Paraburkholderia sp. CNPSo 3272]|uniref:hypothetical protein n=1 Tax=Paraburkholderia sp. CNPSo 3272 TaxID=2940931 RepID=UPI0020B8A017|nr:hypothetical protein [Paraburkholderia sp. CNPSo 3272]MCP3725327.1 hypothetical protein [Paraburkholderia sp. CNPSo 3272]
MTLSTAETAMWRLVQRYTGRVGYRRGAKAEGLLESPPVIDCSGWTGLLLTEAMCAENDASGHIVFSDPDIRAMQAWSDRIIQEIAVRTGYILAGSEINACSLPRCATIGLKMGAPGWAANHPRVRGVTHIVQIVRRPEDDVPFVSESFGDPVRPGISLMSLADWLVRSQPLVQAEALWAVDAFRLASAN